MKLKIQFGEEIRFDVPIRRIIRTRLQWWPGIRVLSRAWAMAGWPKPIKSELTGGILLEDSNP